MFTFDNLTKTVLNRVKGGLPEENGNWHANQKREGGLKRVTSFKSVRKILKMPLTNKWSLQKG